MEVVAKFSEPDTTAIVDEDVEERFQTYESLINQMPFLTLDHRLPTQRRNTPLIAKQPPMRDCKIPP